MKKVLVVVPNTYWIHREVVFAAFRMLRDMRFRTQLMMPVAVPSENNRAQVMAEFLKERYDYLLMLDSDTAPRNCNPLDLVELDLDIVGCPTPVWSNTPESRRAGRPPFYFNVMEYWGAGENGHHRWNPVPLDPDRKLYEVDAVGSGCILIARRVLEALKDKRPFARQTDKAGIVTAGGDLMFCLKAKAAGFSVWAHFGYCCDHIHELSYQEVMEALRAMKNPSPGLRSAAKALERRRQGGKKL